MSEDLLHPSTSDDRTERPARPARGDVHVHQVGDRLLLSYSRRQLGTAGFLLLWLTGWTAGCVMLAGMIINDPTLQHIAFAVPFFAAWIFVACLLVGMLFGKESLVIDRHGLSYRQHAIVATQRRDAPLDEVKAADRARAKDKRPGSETVHTGLVIEMRGAPVLFAQDISVKEQQWLASLVNEHLQDLRSRTGITEREVADIEGTRGETLEVGDRQTLHSGRDALSPPTDSEFRLVRDFDSIRFTSRGHWSLGAIGLLTFVNAFWNGIVSVFVMHLFNEFQWFLAVFLIPFVVIGFGMFLAWAATILAPAIGESYTFRRFELVKRSSLFGIGRSRTTDLSRFERFELQREESDKYTLALVSDENAELAVISDLTEGEARWMADVVLRERVLGKR